MLKKILSKETCKECNFCCSFRKISLWEVPLFSEEQKKNLEKKYPIVSALSAKANLDEKNNTLLNTILFNNQKVYNS